jgi:hypothetical protein
MSTIPTTFSETLPSYTVRGGHERLGTTGLSVVLLNRGGRYARRHIFQDFEKIGFDTIVSVEPEPAHYDIEELSARFPFVRFVTVRGSISLGDQINLAVSELDTPLFIVLWNDLKIIAGGTARRMAERLASFSNGNGETGEKSPFKRLCTVPVIQTSRLETIPTLRAPARRKKCSIMDGEPEIMAFEPKYEGLLSLYPFDGAGIYDRDRFIKMCGFDGTIKNSYWQLMDFGFRAHLWGEEISATRWIKLAYETEVPVEDYSKGEDYKYFYLKNLAPVFRGDSARLPFHRFFGYLFRANSNIVSAWEDFSECRRWLQIYQSRWRCDPQVFANHWNLTEINGER